MGNWQLHAPCFADTTPSARDRFSHKGSRTRFSLATQMGRLCGPDHASWPEQLHDERRRRWQQAQQRTRIQSREQLEKETGSEGSTDFQQRKCPLPPTSPPGYTILEELGRGGMSVVYLAQQHGLDRKVALKVLRSDLLSTPQQEKRFHQEARAVAHLRHPHIVQIYEVGAWELSDIEPHVPFFSLEYCIEGTLADHTSRGPLPAHTSAALVECLTRAAHHAHQLGIIHRDLKPANILLQTHEHLEAGMDAPLDPEDAHTVLYRGYGIPRIGDFGLAKHVHENTGHTHAGQLLGTPNYMAPEQACGETRAITPQTDVYALGAILYECLTGHPPFEAPSVLATLNEVNNRPPVPPSQLEPTVPRDLETICLKCLQKAPGDRYTSALELADELARFLAGDPVQARPMSLVEKAFRWCVRNPAWIAMLLMLLATLAMWLWSMAQLQTERAMRRNSGPVQVRQNPLGSRSVLVAGTPHALVPRFVVEARAIGCVRVSSRCVLVPGHTPPSLVPRYAGAPGQRLYARAARQNLPGWNTSTRGGHN